MIETIGLVLGYAGTAVGLVGTIVNFRRAKRAEVTLNEANAKKAMAEASSKEVFVADQMVELVKKTTSEVLATYKSELDDCRKELADTRLELKRLRKENGILRKEMRALWEAVSVAKSCPYYPDNCPIVARLPEQSSAGAERDA